MKYGISLLPDCLPEVRSAGDYLRDALAICTRADELGLDYVKMTEHYLGNYGGYCPDPLAFLASVAARTENIRLMTGCVLPAFHHPVQLAARAAMVDVMSGGRLEVGFARAWLPYEFAALGVPIDDSRERFQESIGAILRLWTESNVSVDTPYFSFDNANSLPPVYQSPHPPVWGAAIRSKQSFEWLAENGFGLLVSLPPLWGDVEHSIELIDVYRSRFEQVHAGTAVTPHVAVALPLYVAENSQAAKHHATRAVKHSLEVTVDAARSWSHVSSTNYPGYDTMVRAFESVTIDALERDCAGVIGSPAECVDQLHTLREKLNPDVVLWNIDYGGQTYDEMAPSLELFADEVLPQVSSVLVA